MKDRSEKMSLQAVVMAGGRGSRYTDLTARCAKALLPLGPRPLIWYPLNFLWKNGFKECIILMPVSHKNDIVAALNSLSDVNIAWKDEAISNTDECGTADSLRHVIQKYDVKVDLLVVSCDLVTGISLDPLLSLHYTSSSALTVLFAPFPSDLRSTTVPGPKTKKKLDHDFVGIDPRSNRLVLMASEADFDEDTLTFHRYIFSDCPEFVIQSQLLDCHVYILSHRVTEIWLNDENVNSLKGEVIPLLTQKQFRRTKVSRDDVGPDGMLDPIEMSSLIATMGFRFDTDFACFGYVSTTGEFCLRANSLMTYCYANKQMARLWPSFSTDTDGNPIHPSLQCAEGSTVSNDCLVAKNVSVGGGGSNVKSSVVAQDCKIGSNVRLTNCIIMDRVIIRDGCTLQGSIVGRDVVVHDNSQLKDCIVAADQVSSGTKLSGDTIVNEEGFMEIN